MAGRDKLRNYILTKTILFLNNYFFYFMKKLFALLFCLVCFTYLQAGPWIIGLNHVNEFLLQLEQGTGDEVPVMTFNSDFPDELDTDIEQSEGKPANNYERFCIGLAQDGDNVWVKTEDAQEEGLFSLTDGKVEIRSDKFPADDQIANHFGLKTIEIANRGFKQIDGTVVNFTQPLRPDEITFVDWSALNISEGDYREFYSRYDLSWLEMINLSGNDLNNIEIDGRETMPIKVINLSNNPNLTDLYITGCTQLEVVDIRDTGLSADDIQDIIDEVHAYSPDAEILHGGGSSIKTSNASDLVVYMNNNTITVSNKASNDKVYVYNILGKLMLESSDSSIDASRLTSGIYMVKVNNQVSKVIKK